MEIEYVTPLSDAFTKPTCNVKLNYLLEEKQIKLVPDFAIAKVDNDKKQILDYANKAIDFDILVTVPTNKGADIIEESGLGDDFRICSCR